MRRIMDKVPYTLRYKLLETVNGKTTESIPMETTLVARSLKEAESAVRAKNERPYTRVVFLDLPIVHTEG